jgi:SOS-response transcriptional repressor LexA
MELKNRLAEALALAKKSPTQLAAETGLSDSAISQLLSGKTKSLRSNSAVKIEAATGVRATWLIAGEGPMLASTQNVAAAPVGAIRIPLISYVQAGCWTGIVDNYQPGDADEWLLTDLDLSGSAFALQIKGDSMLPEFKEGDRVIIDPTVGPLPGDFVVAKNGDDEATFKKYRPRGVNEQGVVVFELVPLNEDFPSMRSDTQPISIVGTMVEHRKYRKK